MHNVYGYGKLSGGVGEGINTLRHVISFGWLGKLHTWVKLHSQCTWGDVCRLVYLLCEAKNGTFRWHISVLVS